MRKFLAPVLFAAILASISIGGPAQSFKTSGNDGDTPAGTVIKNNGGQNTFNYQDLAENPRPTNYGDTIEVTVAAEKGYSSDATYPPEFYYWNIIGGRIVLFFHATPGSTEVLSVFVTNEGNAQITVTTTLSAVSYSGSADNWTAEIWEGSNNYGSQRTKVIDDNSHYPSFDIKITAATTETDSPDKSSAYFEVILTTEVAQKTGNNGDGHYTGANELTYGGLAGDGPLGIKTTIEAPVLKISRSATVDSPDTYTGWGDGPHAYVPGSLWTYTVTYTNEGTGNAAHVSVIDKVPYNCVVYKVNVHENENYVVVTAPSMTSEVMWYVYYATEEAPPVSMTAYHSNNIDVGSYEAGWYYGDGATGAMYIRPLTDDEMGFHSPERENMKWVKFQAETIPAGQTGTIQWSVYLK